MATYGDADLASAIDGARNWRQVLRTLGLPPTSASARRTARRRADELKLDYGHFTGQRRWTDEQLTLAVARARTWAAVATSLGLRGGATTAALRGHALRLGLDTRHLSDRQEHNPAVPDRPHLDNLPRAGTLLAAAWFELVGDVVSWPLEPCRYDLLVWRAGSARRVQVKTTRLRTSTGWSVHLRTTSSTSTHYGPGEIDDFIIIDGDLRYYLIPFPLLGGRTVVALSRFRQFELPRTPSEV